MGGGGELKKIWSPFSSHKIEGQDPTPTLDKVHVLNRLAGKEG